MAFLSQQKQTTTMYRPPATTSQPHIEYVQSATGLSVPQQVTAATNVHSIRDAFPITAEGYTVFYSDLIESLRVALQYEHRHHGDSSDPSTLLPFEAAVSALTNHIQTVAPTWFEADPTTQRSFAALFDYAPLYSFLVDDNPLNIDTESFRVPYHSAVHSDLIGTVVATLLAYLRDVNGIAI